MDYGDGNLVQAASGEDEDDALAIRSRSDTRSFELLYHRNRDRIYRYALTRVGTQEDALDLTQQTFVKALERINTFRPRRGQFSTWLFAIARNTVIDFRRRQRSPESWVWIEPTAQDNTEAEVLTSLDVEALRTAVAGLTDMKRDLLSLRFAAGLTVPEIAAVVGMKTDATYKQITRTLEELRGALNGQIE